MKILKASVLPRNVQLPGKLLAFFLFFSFFLSKMSSQDLKRETFNFWCKRLGTLPGMQFKRHFHPLQSLKNTEKSLRSETPRSFSRCWFHFKIFNLNTPLPMFQNKQANGKFGPTCIWSGFTLKASPWNATKMIYHQLKFNFQTLCSTFCSKSDFNLTHARSSPP